jgi:hypothetical protein
MYSGEITLAIPVEKKLTMPGIAIFVLLLGVWWI